ncbi:MAG: HEAT repeat domain-containing protein [Methylococcaceae bacterium]|jgi:HEAT repeat protein
MNYRPKILLIFALLLGLIFYGAVGYTKVNTPLSKEHSKSATNTEKTSSSNIHFDEIVIKGFPGAQSGNSAISDEKQKELTLKISNDAQEDFMSWCKRQGLIIAILGVVAFFAVIGFIWFSIDRTIEKSVEKLVKEEIARSNRLIDNAVSRLVDKQAEIVVVTDKTIEATTNANDEIDKAKKILGKLQDTGNELENKQSEFQIKINEEIKNKEKEIVELGSKTESIKDEQKAFNDELKSKTENEIPQLEQKINALERVISILDKDGKAKDQVVTELITYLESKSLETRNEVAEFLPRFEPESSKINTAFLDILNNKNPDRKFRPILLSGLGKLRNDGNTLAYLIKLVENMNDSDMLAIIGALGEIGETGDISEIGKISKTKITDTELESIIDKLLSILNDDLDSKAFSKESEITASDIRGAISLALSYYGKKAARAVNDLINLLADKKPETCINACIALGRIGVQDAIPALQKLIDDEDTWEEVKKAASESIEKIQQSA